MLMARRVKTGATPEKINGSPILSDIPKLRRPKPTGARGEPRAWSQG
jgi:hypothetical protein